MAITRYGVFRLLCCAGNAKLADIRARVEAFASGFPMPGFDVDGLH
jgi:hypothetical protein